MQVNKDEPSRITFIENRRNNGHRYRAGGVEPTIVEVQGESNPTNNQDLGGQGINRKIAMEGLPTSIAKRLSIYQETSNNSEDFWD